MTECMITADTCGATEDDYLLAFQQNLPKGAIWSLEDDSRVMSRFWRSISSSFAACSQFLCSILLEVFPCTATAMLERWAAIFGYPSDCPSPKLTADRLCEWIDLQDSDCAGPTISYLQQVAAWLGYPEASLAEWGVTPSSLGCGQVGCMQLGGSRDAPALHGCQQFLIVTMFANTDSVSVDTASAEMGAAEFGSNDLSTTNCAPPVLTRFAQIGSCSFQLGCSPLCGLDPPAIMCLIAKFVPAHVCIFYQEF